MKLNKYTISLLVAVLMLLQACQKKDNTVATPSQVNISISSPVNGQTFHANDTVMIKADVSYATELHGYEVKITDTSTGLVLYDDAQHVHNDHFSISERWNEKPSTAATLKMEVIAEIDHDGNTANKSILINYKP